MALSEWKDIIGYEGYYKIRLYDNEFGCEIFSLKSGACKNRERLLKPNIESRGYYRIELHKDGERKTIKIHRLISIHFIPNPENLKDVDHIDNNRKNNNINNLRWVTPRQNIQNRKKYQINGENCSSKYKGVYFFKRDNKWRAQIRINGKRTFLGSFENEEDAAKIYDLKADEINHFGPRNFTNQ